VHVDDLAPDDPLVRVARALITSGSEASRGATGTSVQPPVLGLTMDAAPDPVAPAGMLTYHLTATNHGTGDAVQVELRMTLPVGVFGCGTLSDGGHAPQGCAAGRDVVWTLGTMASQAMRTVQAVVQIRGDVPSGRSSRPPLAWRTSPARARAPA